MKFEYGLSAALMGVTIALVQPQAATALSPPEVGNIAEKITVLIERTDSKDQGSGVIVKHEGNTYYLLTAFHVVDQADKYIIIAPDGEQYPLNYSTVKKMATGVDLAIMQFNSSKTYTVAKMGNSDQATAGTTAYVAGFPLRSSTVTRSIYRFVNGQITANARQPLDDGYALVYSNITLPGMSGGPVLNESGEVVGIHGKAETTVKADASDKNFESIPTGFNVGIPINTYLRLSPIAVGVRPPMPTAAAPKADDFFIQGGNKAKKGDYQGAIAAYNEAIRINPKYTAAYKDRGLANFQLKDYRAANADLSQAISLDPNESRAYAGRGIVRYVQGDKQGSIEDFNQALRLNPNYAPTYNARGLIRYFEGNKQGSIEDLNQAIRLNPNNASAYNVRGNAHLDLKDYPGALEDFNQATRLNPNNADNYERRGLVRAQLGDKQGALEDFNQAIRLNPNDAKSYVGRGAVHFELGDKQGALADLQRGADLTPPQQRNTVAYKNLQNAIRNLQRQGTTTNSNQASQATNSNQASQLNSTFATTYIALGDARLRLGDYQKAFESFNQAIRFNPNNADAYYKRADTRAQLGDKQGAIADFNQAIRLNPSNAYAYKDRGLVRSQLGDNRGAIEDLNQAIRLNPNEPKAYIGRGAIHLQLGDKQGALADLQRAADLTPPQQRSTASFQKLQNAIRVLQRYSK